MKKIISLVVTAFVLLLTASSAQADTYSFKTDLKVGSTGADVSALQTWLIQNMYHIPSIEAGKVSKGIFGGETKAAVQKFQKDRKLPTTGFVGPLTRGQLNSSPT